MAKRTYGELEDDDGRQQEMFEVLRLQAEDIHRLLQTVLGPQQRLLREQEERRLRAQMRSFFQEEMFEQGPRPVVRKQVDQSKKRSRTPNYTKAEFEPLIHETIRLLGDPEELDKLTNRRAAERLNITQNTLWGYLKNYGYIHAGETLSKCLHRLAREWQNVQNDQSKNR